MKFCTLQSAEFGTTLASFDDEAFTVLLDANGEPLRCLDPYLRGQSSDELLPGPVLSPAQIQWLPPVARPSKIFGIGLNYADHARETGAVVGEVPVVFNKLPSAISAHAAPIKLPDLSHQVDFEAELVVVIGRGGHQIPLDQAREHVFGYCCGNDVSARDWQKGKPGGQYLLGKSFDSFAPIGPWVVTADEVGWPVELDVKLELNGETMQSSNTRQLIFGIDFLIWHLSRFCTLEPGDLIFTGTPAGVGVARTPPRFLQSGDQVDVVVERLGRLTNPVSAS